MHRIDLSDIMIFIGLAMAFVGLWLWDPRIALVVVGLLMAGVGLVAAVRSA